MPSENIEITIIIPVYNVENFLDRCVSSILTQDFDKFEIILIDDGSPDNSGVLCDKIASQDNRIRVIHQSNKGVSIARNTGLNAAKGRYICFVDGDDTLEKNALSNMWEQVELHPGVDVVCGQLLHGNHILATPATVPDYINDRKQIRNFYLWTVLNYFAVGRLVSRNLIFAHNIFFAPGISCGEDPLWVYFIHKHVQSIAQCRKVVYVYETDNEGSTMHQKNRTRFYCSTLETAIIASRNLGPDGRNAENAYLLDLLSANRLTDALANGEKEEIHKKVTETYQHIKQLSKRKHLKNSARIAAWRLNNHDNRLLWQFGGILYTLFRVVDKVQEKILTR